MSKVSLAIETEKAGLKQVLLWRKLGKKIGFTNGCFDLLHPDHEAELTATLEVEKPTDQPIDGSSIPLA